jgi:hypothetical protein
MGGGKHFPPLPVQVTPVALIEVNFRNVIFTENLLCNWPAWFWHCAVIWPRTVPTLWLHTMLKITWHVYINHNPQNVNIDLRWQVVTLTKYLTNKQTKKLHSTEPELKAATSTPVQRINNVGGNRTLSATSTNTTFGSSSGPDKSRPHLRNCSTPCSVRGPFSSDSEIKILLAFLIYRDEWVVRPNRMILHEVIMQWLEQ